MKTKNVRISMHYMLVVLGACMIANVATAKDDDGEQIKIKGTRIGMITQFDNLGLSQGRAVSDVGLDGRFYRGREPPSVDTDSPTA